LPTLSDPAQLSTENKTSYSQEAVTGVAPEFFDAGLLFDAPSWASPALWQPHSRSRMSGIVMNEPCYSGPNRYVVIRQRNGAQP
jgi:hypothetical protein